MSGRYPQQVGASTGRGLNELRPPACFRTDRVSWRLTNAEVGAILLSDTCHQSRVTTPTYLFQALHNSELAVAMKPRSTSKRPTSKDVAELAGVSRTTVSYVINKRTGGNIRISDETRRRVWEAVEALNYRPSSAAQTLRTRRSNLLAVMIPRVENPFYPHFAAAIQQEAEKVGLDVIIYSTHNELQREKEFLNVLLRRGVDGRQTPGARAVQEPRGPHPRAPRYLNTHT